MDFKALGARIKNQDACKEAVRAANYNAAFISTVGSGKGKIFIDLAMELWAAGKIKNVLYLCDSTRLRDTNDGFPGELAKWGVPDFNRIFTMECYQTVYKWANQKFDMVIADEFDFAITPSYLKFFLNNKWDYIILASGTLTPEKRKIAKTIAPIVFTLTMSEAEERGIVNKTQYYVYNFKMTEEESRTYDSLTRKISTLMSIEVGFDDPDMTFWLRKRKLFLNSLESSYLNCRKLMQHVYNENKTNRIVIFCELTSQADKVCKYSFHGGNEDEDNLSKYQNGEINAIAVVAKVQRGINLIKTNWGIFESMSGSTTRFEQKGGRFKRLGIDEMAHIVFMVPWAKRTNKDINGNINVTWKETVVKGWIDRATKNIPNLQLKNIKI